jgi:hypothetical protein
MMILTFLFLGLVLPATAQTAKASISGIVKDSSGAVVAGAAITVIDLQRNGNYTARSNETGFYLVQELIPGTYRVAAELSGFRAFVLDNFPLATQQKATVNITLEIGSVSEQVLVTATSQMIEASNATLSSVVENKKIVDLPLNSRSIYTLTKLVPGVTPSVPNSDSEGMTGAHRYAINGGRESTTDFLLDGVTTLVQSNQSGVYLAAAQPSVEGIQEFRIQTNAFSAEYGRTGGGIVTMVTKSGGNELHGSVFEFLRNSALDSNNFFANRSGTRLAAFQQHQFGGSAGGPIVRNRTFFFALYEGKRINEGYFRQDTVPNAAERRGDFSDTRDAQGRLRVIYDPFTTRANPAAAGRYIRDPIPGNVIAGSRLDPVAVNSLKLYPEPNQTGLPFTRQFNLVTMKSRLNPTDRIEFKVDHNFTSSHRLFLRYNFLDTDGGAPDSWGNKATPVNSPMRNKAHNAVLDYTQTIGSATVVNARYGISRLLALRPGYSNGFDISTLGFPKEIAQVAQVAVIPTFSIQDYTQLGPPGGDYYLSSNTAHSALATLSRVIGRHSIKTGVEFRAFLLGFQQIGGPSGSYNFSRVMTQGPDARTPSAIAGVGLASMLLGAADGGSIAHAAQPMVSNKYLGLYVQDDFRLHQRLTINAGLRWELESAQTERYDRQTVIDPFVRNPLSEKTGLDLRGGYLYAGSSLGRRALRDLEKNKLNPRLGVAYQWNDQTTIRAGYGIFFGVPAYAANNFFVGDPFGSSTSFLATLDGITPNYLLRNPFPDGFNLPQGAALGLLGGVGFNLKSVWPETLNSMYNQQWNFTIQRSLARDMMLEVAYAGNKGTRLQVGGAAAINRPHMNQILPELMRQENRLLELVPNPFFGLVSGGILAQPTVQRGQLLRPFPHFNTAMPMSAGWGNSNYHALQARFEKRFSAGASLMASYTWSKTISDASDGIWNDIQANLQRSWYCRACERAISTYDQPQRLITSFTYELPFGKGKRFGAGWNRAADLLLGDWQTNGILTLAGGQPLRIGLSQNTSNSFGGGQQPDSTGVNADLGGARTLSRWFDTTQFTRAAEYTFGNLARTHPNLRADWNRGIDLSLFKDFRILERLELQFRAEAFNFTNTPIFSPPNGTFDAPTFGVVNAQNNAPRQVQLGLKLLF